MRKWLFDPTVGADTARIRFFSAVTGVRRADGQKDICRSVFFHAILFFMILAGHLLFPRHVRADQCRFTSVPSAVSFGNIFSGDQGALSQPVEWECTSGFINLQAETAACYTVEPTAGDLSGATRVMRGTGGAAGYNLLFNLADMDQNVLLGARVTAQFGNAPQNIKITGILGIIPLWATYDQTIIGTIPANQVVPAGQYSTTSSIYVFYRSSLLGIAFDCWSGQTMSSNISIEVTVQPRCNVSATDIDFGTQNLLTRPLYAQGTITVNCTLAQPYQIALATNGFPVGQRRMINGSQYIQYGLFSDSAYSNAWGTTVPVTGVGTGTDQAIPVYARVLPQATPRSGAYTDTVAITVTY